MSPSGDVARRVRIERNIYRRSTGVLEVGFKDAAVPRSGRVLLGGLGVLVAWPAAGQLLERLAGAVIEQTAHGSEDRALQ